MQNTTPGNQIIKKYPETLIAQPDGYFWKPFLTSKGLILTSEKGIVL
jgi:hypothetical protein